MTSLDERTDARDAAPSMARAQKPGAVRVARRVGPPSPGARRLLGFLVLPVSLLLAGLLTAPSYAVFNGSTSNAANNWASGTVVLQNASSGTAATTGAAVFNAPGLQPRAAVTKCVAVTSTSSVSTGVSMYLSNVTGALADYINVSVEMGSGGSGTNGDCSNYVSGTALMTNVRLSSTPTTFAAGSTGWAPTGSSTRVFKITCTVDATVPNTLQSSTSGATFVWEAQST